MADSRRTRSNARLIHGRREPEPPLWAIFPPRKARQRRPAFSFSRLSSFFFFFHFLFYFHFSTKYRTRAALSRPTNSPTRAISSARRRSSRPGDSSSPKKRPDATTAQTTASSFVAPETQGD